MYSKEQSAILKQAFWTAFGQYMVLQPTNHTTKVNWINYKTGIKHINFKMEADQYRGKIAIIFSHPDPGIQELMFEQLVQYKNILNGYLEEEWIWKLHDQDEYGKTISGINISIEGVSIFNKADWPALISFFKSRIMALDEFWEDAKYAFEIFN